MEEAKAERRPMVHMRQQMGRCANIVMSRAHCEKLPEENCGYGGQCGGEGEGEAGRRTGRSVSGGDLDVYR